MTNNPVTLSYNNETIYITAQPSSIGNGFYWSNGQLVPNPPVNPQELVNRASVLSNQIQDHYYDLGELLWTLKEGNHYKKVDNNAFFHDKHGKWKDFCETKLSVGYRRAQYYLNMYRYFSEMNVTKEQLQGIGWSKAKELIDLTSDQSVLNDCLEKAKTYTLAELQNHIATFAERIGTTEETLKVRNLKFRLVEHAGETVEELIELAAKTTGGDRDAALHKICVEWAQFVNPYGKEEYQEVFALEDKEEI